MFLIFVILSDTNVWRNSDAKHRRELLHSTMWEHHNKEYIDYIPSQAIEAFDFAPLLFVLYSNNVRKCMYQYSYLFHLIEHTIHYISLNFQL